MSNLEDLWDELPTGTPPVDTILGSGRARVARRRKLTRTLITVGASAAVIGAFVAGAVVGNRPGPTVAAPPKLFDARTLKAALTPHMGSDKCGVGNVCPHVHEYLLPVGKLR